MGRFYSTPLFCYFLGFILPYLLTFIPFVVTVGDYSAATHTLILASIAGYAAGVLVAHRWTRRTGAQVRLLPDPDMALPHGTVNLLYGWYVVGAGCLLLEFVTIGGFPLFMPNVETLRLTLQINGITHLLSVSLGLVSAMMLYASTGFQMDRVDKLACRYLGIAGFLLHLLSGNRSEGGIFLASYVVAVMLKDRTVFRRKYALWLAGFVAVFIAINIFRQTQHDPHYQLYALQAMLVSPTKTQIFLYPLYLSLTYNFTILDKLVAATNGGGITHGIYTFYGFLSVFPTKPLQYGEFKNNLLGIKFYSELTSTYVSNFYLDFGLWGAVLGSFFHGVLIQKIYALAKSDRRYLLLYGTIFVNYAMFFYCYIYYYFLFIIALPVTALFCAYGLKYRGQPVKVREIPAVASGPAVAKPRLSLDAFRGVRAPKRDD